MCFTHSQHCAVPLFQQSTVGFCYTLRSNQEKIENALGLKINQHGSINKNLDQLKASGCGCQNAEYQWS